MAQADRPEGTDMATNRRRTRRAATLPPEINGLFMVGTSHNHLPDGEFEKLWKRHGATFVRQRPDWRESSWAALMQMPDPNEGGTST